MTCKINADTSDGLKIVSDTSGAVDIQSNGVTKVTIDANGNVNTVGQVSTTDNGTIVTRQTAKPIIINGDMQVAQRGTSTTGITTSGYYTVDRFAVTISALGTWTQTQDTTVPTAKGFTKSLKMDCTTADASPAAGDLVLLSYKVEAQDLQLLKYGTSSAEAFTLRFHVRSPKTGTHIVHIYQNDGARHISKAYTISSADTFQEVIINIPGDTGGTVNNDNACGMQIEFYLAAGSNSTSGTLATSWAGYAQANSAVGQVNCADNTANNFFITGLQMEVGEYDSTTIPPFQHELYGDNLARCQRYCQVYGPHGNTMIGVGMTQNASNVYRWDFTNMKTSMRAAPSGAISGTVNCWNGGTGANAVLGTSYNTTELVGYDLSCDAGLTNTTGIVAKIFLNTGTFTLTAEL